ncbi:MAG: acyl-CoA desaturase [Myxococcota bacterium]|nr:acyl-CoA desaturase [Myxococcota bacterium]
MTELSGTTVQASAVPDRERLRAFGDAIDALKARIESEVGPADLAYVRRVDRFSRTMEVIGRVLIHLSPEPLSFGAGVIALWIHKQLQATEVGHTVLHGAYDRIEGRGRFDSKTWWWALPIDEESWRYGHNVRHHGATNVAGKDADIHFGPVRLTEQTAHRPEHRFQLLFALAVLFPNFAFTMNLHFTGLNDVYWDNGRPEKLDFLPDRSPASRRLAWTRALRKFVPYYALEYGVYPALAGPFFWKVLLGNWMAETMRDVYSAATIFCGHVGERTKSYPAGTKPAGRGEWYAMQVEATNDYEVPRWVSVLCGGLDRQIEHHLFPKLAPERLRQIAPEVRALCEAHGVEHRSASWPETLRSALSWIDALAKERGPVAGTRAAIEAMA